MPCLSLITPNSLSIYDLFYFDNTHPVQSIYALFYFDNTHLVQTPVTVIAKDVGKVELTRLEAWTETWIIIRGKDW